MGNFTSRRCLLYTYMAGWRLSQRPMFNLLLVAWVHLEYLKLKQFFPSDISNKSYTTFEILWSWKIPPLCVFFSSICTFRFLVLLIRLRGWFLPHIWKYLVNRKKYRIVVVIVLWNWIPFFIIFSVKNEKRPPGVSAHSMPLFVENRSPVHSAHLWLVDCRLICIFLLCAWNDNLISIIKR